MLAPEYISRRNFQFTNANIIHCCVVIGLSGLNADTYWGSKWL